LERFFINHSDLPRFDLKFEVIATKANEVSVKWCIIISHEKLEVIVLLCLFQSGIFRYIIIS